MCRCCFPEVSVQVLSAVVLQQAIVLLFFLFPLRSLPEFCSQGAALGGGSVGVGGRLLPSPSVRRSANIQECLDDLVATCVIGIDYSACIRSMTSADCEAPLLDI